MSIYVFTMLIILITVESLSSDLTPLMIIIFAREGISTPEIKTKTLVKTEALKRLGSGNLTPEGERQLYYLGLLIRDEYKSIFEGKIEQKDMFIASLSTATNFDSAISLMSGMIQDPTELPFKKNDPRTLPSYTVSKDIIDSIDFTTPLPSNLDLFTMHKITRDGVASKDYLFFDASNNLDCPKFEQYLGDYKEIQNQIMISYLNGLSDFNEMLEEVKSEIPGLDIDAQNKTNITMVDELCDYVYLNSILNETTKITDGNNAYEFFKRIRQVLFYLDKFPNLHKSLNLTVSPILNETLHILNKKARTKNSSKNQEERKLIYYSSSDSVIAGMMWFFDQVDLNCIPRNIKEHKSEACKEIPDFSSNFIIELLESKEEKKFYVRVRYEGLDIKPCASTMTTSEGKKVCELEAFIEEMQRKIDNDWQANCGIENPRESDEYASNVFLIMVLMTSFFALTVISIIFVLRNYMKKDKGFSKNMLTDYLSFEHPSSPLEEEFNLDMSDNKRVNVKMS